MADHSAHLHLRRPEIVGRLRRAEGHAVEHKEDERRQQELCDEGMPGRTMDAIRRAACCLEFCLDEVTERHRVPPGPGEEALHAAERREAGVVLVPARRGRNALAGHRSHDREEVAGPVLEFGDESGGAREPAAATDGRRSAEEAVP